MQAVLAHSPQLQSAAREVDATAARQTQARAGGQAVLSADARAARYTGLVDSAFGQQLIIPAIESRYGAGLQLTQPLYTGGRVSSQREGTDLQRGAAELTQRSTQADVVYLALTAYWNWSKTHYAVESFQSAVARMAEHHRDMQNQHQAGLATDNDALATEVQLEQTRLKLEAALRAVEYARARLAFLTGRDWPATAAPQPAPTPVAAAMPDEATLLAAARTNRAERAARRMETQAAAAQVRASGADRRPQLALIARYEQGRPNQLNIPPRDEWADDAYAGVALSWNFWDSGLTRAKVAEAAARLAQSKLRQTQTEDQIALDVRETRLALTDAGERHTVTQRLAQSARRNLQAATDLWKNGLARHADVLDAHSQLTDAEFQASAARADIALARAALDRATGSKTDNAE
ncbi:MAG: TolC family protein [Kiritimatiellaeota bacterium]|nr:TolC family protein [Kiritimatiellota bacterium]